VVIVVLDEVEQQVQGNHLHLRLEVPLAIGCEVEQAVVVRQVVVGGAAVAVAAVVVRTEVESGGLPRVGLMHREVLAHQARTNLLQWNSDTHKHTHAREQQHTLPTILPYPACNLTITSTSLALLEISPNIPFFHIFSNGRSNQLLVVHA
jgi:hypothetical protein